MLGVRIIFEELTYEKLFSHWRLGTKKATARAPEYLLFSRLWNNFDCSRHRDWDCPILHLAVLDEGRWYSKPRTIGQLVSYPGFVSSDRGWTVDV